MCARRAPLGMRAAHVEPKISNRKSLVDSEDDLLADHGFLRRSRSSWRRLSQEAQERFSIFCVPVGWYSVVILNTVYGILNP